MLDRSGRKPIQFRPRKFPMSVDLIRFPMSVDLKLGTNLSIKEIINLNKI